MDEHTAFKVLRRHYETKELYSAWVQHDSVYCITYVPKAWNYPKMENSFGIAVFETVEAADRWKHLCCPADAEIWRCTYTGTPLRFMYIPVICSLSSFDRKLLNVQIFIEEYGVGNNVKSLSLVKRIHAAYVPSHLQHTPENTLFVPRIFLQEKVYYDGTK